jgi:hypothetical protein
VCQYCGALAFKAEKERTVHNRCSFPSLNPLNESQKRKRRKREES